MHRLSEKEKLEFRRFVKALFAQEVASVEAALSEIQVPPPFQMRLRVAYSRFPAREILARHISHGRVIPAEGTGGFVTDFKTRGGRRVRVPFGVLPTDFERILVFVTICESSEWRDLNSFLDKLYPSLVPIYLSQRELITSVKSLRAANLREMDMRVREFSAKEKAPGSHAVTRSVREWTDESFDQLLEQISSRSQVLQSVRLEFRKRIGHDVNPTPALSCKVTRNSHLHIDGRFQVARMTVVSQIARIGAEKLEFFSNRSLRDRKYKAAPLCIRYAEDVFKDTAEARRLVKVLEGFPNSMHAVQHRNPYVHVKVSDRFDGSCFEVWALSSHAITVVPRLRATEAAVERLVHYIFEEFREGDVIDAEAEAL